FSADPQKCSFGCVPLDAQKQSHMCTGRATSGITPHDTKRFRPGHRRQERIAATNFHSKSGGVQSDVRELTVAHAGEYYPPTNLSLTQRGFGGGCATPSS